MPTFVASVALLCLLLNSVLSLVPSRCLKHQVYRTVCSAQTEPGDPLSAVKTSRNEKAEAKKVAPMRQLSSNEERKIVTIEFLENEIMKTQKELIENISQQLLQSYYPIAEQYAIRGALILLASHVMVLIPVLKFVKSDLNMSIVPYLYIGPLLVLLPFILLFAWDTNIARVAILDTKLKEYLKLQKSAATDSLAKEGDNWLNSLREYDEETSKDVVKRLGYLRILSNMDVDISFLDIISTKRSGGSRSPLSPSLAGGELKSATAYTAVTRILDATSGEEPTELLEKLYEVKKELDKEGDSDSNGGLGPAGYLLKMTINALDAITGLLKKK